jgi:hypothetical protein
VPSTAAEGVPVVDDGAPVSVQRLQMPIAWVVAVVAAIVAGALSLSLVYYRAESHAEDAAKHLGPEVAQQGGVVTPQRLRRVLRKMEINCVAAQGGGLACRVTLPEEAE